MMQDRYSNHTLLQIQIEDITESKSEQNDLEQAAYHDGLTGLLNRTAALEQIETYFADHVEPHEEL